MINLLAHLFFVWPLKLLLAPLKLIGPAVKLLVLPLKLIGPAVKLALLPLKLVTLPLRLLT